MYLSSLVVRKRISVVGLERPFGWNLGLGLRQQQSQAFVFAQEGRQMFLSLFRLQVQVIRTLSDQGGIVFNLTEGGY
jgi:hypothetical protein